MTVFGLLLAHSVPRDTLISSLNSSHYDSSICIGAVNTFRFLVIFTLEICHFSPLSRGVSRIFHFVGESTTENDTVTPRSGIYSAYYYAKRPFVLQAKRARWYTTITRSLE